MKAVLEQKQHEINRLIQRVAELEFTDKMLWLYGILFMVHAVQLMLE